MGVEYLEISFWNQYSGQQVILGSVSHSGSLAADWNTSGLTPDTYTLRAYAYDAMGNWSQAEVPVVVTAGTGGTLRVTGIALTAKRSGSTVNVAGEVTVKDAAGRAAANANVTIRWSVPGGVTQVASAVTGSTGRARFTVSGPRGTYTLTVTGVAKTGYDFDAAGSILSRSISR